MGRKDKLEAGLENLFSKPKQSRRRKKASASEAEPATQELNPAEDAPTTPEIEPTPNSAENSVTIATSQAPENEAPADTAETLPQNDPLGNSEPEGAATLPPQETTPQAATAEGEIKHQSNPGTQVDQTQAAAEEISPTANEQAADATVAQNPPLKPLQDNGTPELPQQAEPPHPGDTTPQTPTLNENTNAVTEIKKQFVVFMLADEFYGIEIFSVESIIRMQAITPVPRAPKFVRGLTNLRGSVLPVVNLHTRCGLPPQAESKDTRIVIVEIDEMHVGLMVDKVTGVLSIAESAIEPPAPLITTIDSNFIKNIAKIEASRESAERLIVLLNLSQILTVENTAN